MFDYIIRLIKLSSPKLNYMIIIGAIILYMDVYLFVIPLENERYAVVVCNVSSV